MFDLLIGIHFEPWSLVWYSRYLAESYAGYGLYSLDHSGAILHTDLVFDPLIGNRSEYSKFEPLVGNRSVL